MELTASGDLRWYKTIERDLTYESDLPGRLISASYDDQLFILLNDDKANYEKRRNKEVVDRQAGPKDATLLEFKPDGTEKPTTVLAEGPSGQFQPSSVWRLSPSTIATLGASGFGAKATYPVLIQFSKDARK
jgi:hypothetical protein